MRGSVDQAWPFTAEYTAEREKPKARERDRIIVGRNEGERDTTYFAVPRDRRRYSPHIPYLDSPPTPLPIQKRAKPPRASTLLSHSLSLSLSLSLCSLFSVDRALSRSSLSSRSLERPLPRAYIAAKLSLSPSSPIANRAFTIPLFSPLPFSVLCLSCTRLLVYPKVCVRRPSFSPLATHSSARPVSPSVPFYRAQTTGLLSRSRLIPPNLGYLRHPATDPNPWRPFALSRGCESRGVYLYGWRTSKPSERTNQRSRL